ncbi:MAG: SlyX family protein [Sphaerochaetaceae bacterium]|nr:SlyX family protein [Spirochaetales bacterium]MDY5499996.1 SlyX family protein [Sphaerochaetaceae bacterium]
MESERVEKVEIKLSYLEETVDQLNEIVVAQQKEMVELHACVDALKKKVAELMLDEGEEIANRRPPHY